MHRSFSRFRQRAAGITLVEFLVVLVIIGVLVAVTMVIVRPAGTRVAVNDVGSLVRQARYEAVKQDVPVVLAYNGVSTSFEIRVIANSTTIGTVCTTGTVVDSKSLTDNPGVAASGGLTTTSVVWLPSGLVKLCDGTSLATTGLTTTLSDGRASQAIVITRAGRVSIQ